MQVALLVRFDESELQRAQGEDLFGNLLTQACDVDVLHVPQQVLHTCAVVELQSSGTAPVPTPNFNAAFAFKISRQTVLTTHRSPQPLLLLFRIEDA